MEKRFSLAGVDFDIVRNEDDGTSTLIKLGSEYTSAQKRSLCDLLNEVYQEGRNVLRSDWKRFEEEEPKEVLATLLLYSEKTGTFQLFHEWGIHIDESWKANWTHWSYLKNIIPPISMEEEKQKVIQEVERSLDDMKVVFDSLMGFNKELQNGVLAGKLKMAKESFDRLIAINKREISKK